MFDKNIPPPKRETKWPFDQAEIGDSLGFKTQREADTFCAAVRRYAKANNKPWSTQRANNHLEWRVWIVEGHQPAPQPPQSTYGYRNPYNNAQLRHPTSPADISSGSDLFDDEVQLTFDGASSNGPSIRRAVRRAADEGSQFMFEDEISERQDEERIDQAMLDTHTGHRQVRPLPDLRQTNMAKMFGAKLAAAAADDEPPAITPEEPAAPPTVVGLGGLAAP